MSLDLHVRCSWRPVIEPDERDWWVEVLWLTGMFDLIDIAAILDINQPEACQLLHKVRGLNSCPELVI